MVRHALALAIALMLAGTLLADEPYDKAAEQTYEKEVLARREEGLYRKIAWKEGMNEALAAAQEANRPILVFVVVGQWAKKGAEDC